VQIFHAGGDSSGRAAAANAENKENGFQEYFDGGRTGSDILYWWRPCLGERIYGLAG
jgi:hypothetical protein